ncbi:MAG: hypothetical protein B5766_05385 [Candidatus Lumbricidophila eiseniae]|uniref:Uncharacterized protein n=1 Tax=Candidatus Lumbricidiphila eiseniae TaxID=1969409 RepID=A0A2A6FS00_9MICO|nr:MAG: hypothetical protein B5766_05385 [Candidatus Lumbricidophila eiseniae]
MKSYACSARSTNTAPCVRRLPDILHEYGENLCCAWIAVGTPIITPETIRTRFPAEQFADKPANAERSAA